MDNKKKPGRPRKKNTNVVIPKKTLIDGNFNKIVDILYENPGMFKKIFNIFKNYSVEDIHIKFEKEVMKMYSTDSIKKNKIYVEIYGNKMYKYECHDPTKIIISLCVAKRILTEITKESSTCGFTIEDNNSTNKIILITSNPDHDIETHSHLDYSIDTEYEWEIEELINQRDKYPIQFELSSKFFKNKVSNLKPFASIMTFEKNNDGYLRINAMYKDHHGETNSFFKSPEKIKLISNIAENDIFAAPVYLDYIKSVTSSLISDDISIFADKERDLIFMFLLDQDEVSQEGKHIKAPGTEHAKIFIATELVKNLN
jgi:hypothetical protein